MNTGKQKKLFRTVTELAVAAVLTAASVALGYLAKSIFGPGPLRLTFENTPIFLGSFIFGPVVGGVIAVGADLLSCLSAGMSPIPLISIGAFFVGSLSGVFYRHIVKKKSDVFRITLSVCIGHLIGSSLVKSLALYPFYGRVVFFRIPIYIGTSVLESLFLIFLLRNSGVKRQLRSFEGNKES